MEFSAEDNLERREFLNSAKCLGGIHLKEFHDDIEYINRRQESQSNHIPHLMKLKDLANCKFIGYGDDYRPSDSSVNLEEWFLQAFVEIIRSLIALRMIRLSLKDGTSRYFEADEFFYPKEKLKNMSIIQILNCHMMKLHHKHWEKTTLYYYL
ncbi:hypothetical protein F8M41_006001 [Gigaspora margarita]|uniref:Uncharacterized protein n=1 Tax=Gigaspora margarita TaxID=4874 RepID=A0A8H3X7U5_GIGMA|nr:hypothetical protein F8M41_006001 [Gigaspora margarita]